MAGTIGGADDFYRLRVLRVDESDVPDMEWRDDILYRKPEAASAGEYDEWQLQAVGVDDDDVHVLGAFASAEEAHERLEEVADDLRGMTRSRFESRYFTGDEDVTEES